MRETKDKNMVQISNSFQVRFDKNNTMELGEMEKSFL